MTSVSPPSRLCCHSCPPLYVPPMPCQGVSSPRETALTGNSSGTLSFLNWSILSGRPGLWGPSQTFPLTGAPSYRQYPQLAVLCTHPSPSLGLEPYGHGEAYLFANHGLWAKHLGPGYWG